MAWSIFFFISLQAQTLVFTYYDFNEIGLDLFEIKIAAGKKIQHKNYLDELVYVLEVSCELLIQIELSCAFGNSLW